MKDHVSFLGLKNDGTVIGLFSDRYHIYVFYQDFEGQIYYKFVLDKTYMIESVSEIHFPPDLDKNAFAFCRWATPVQTDHYVYQYRGFCLVDDIECRFTIDESCQLEVTESSFKSKNLPGAVKCLPDVEIETFVQYGEHLYLAGWDNQNDEQVYCKVDTANDVCLRRYQLCSGTGDINIRAINVDTTEQRVYVGGEIITTDEHLEQTSTPFFEVFLK